MTEETFMNTVEKSLEALQDIQDKIEAGMPLRIDGNIDDYASRFAIWQGMVKQFDYIRDIMIRWYLESSHGRESKEPFYNPFEVHGACLVALILSDRFTGWSKDTKEATSLYREAGIRYNRHAEWDLGSRFDEIISDAVRIGIKIDEPYGVIKKEISMCVEYYQEAKRREIEAAYANKNRL